MNSFRCGIPRRPGFAFFRFLVRAKCPRPLYYWLLDRLTDNNGWRPLSMRHPEWFR